MIISKRDFLLGATTVSFGATRIAAAATLQGSDPDHLLVKWDGLHPSHIAGCAQMGIATARSIT